MGELGELKIGFTSSAPFNSSIPQIGLVAAGLGVSVLPASYQRIRIDGVVYRTLLDPEAVTAVWLVQRKGVQTPMAKAFVELLVASGLAPRWAAQQPQ